MNKKAILSVFLTSASLFLAACGSSGSPSSSSDDNTPKKSKLFVFGSDYKSGELRWMNPGDSALSSDSLGFYNDSKIIARGEYLFVLSRESGSENIAVIDAEKISEGKSAVIGQHSIEAGSNPNDLAFVSDSVAWLAEYNLAKLIKINPFTGKALDSVSTAAFAAKGATSPNMADLAITGDTLIALMQRSANYVFSNPGLVALYNTGTGKLLDTISLKTSNPQAMAIYKGKLWIATAGAYNASYGFDADSLRGLESIDLTVKNPAAELVKTGKDFGGGLYGSLVLDSADGILYAPVYVSYGSVSLASYDIAGKSIGMVKGIKDAEGSLCFDEYSGELYIGDRTYGSEKIYAYADGTLTGIDGGNALAPYGIALARW